MPSNGQVVELDGSLGEGGGQMLRTALGLSAVLGKPFHMKNIRAGRARPGLQNQHLKAVELMQKLTGAEVTGNAIGSTELAFIPSKKPQGSIALDAGTAASLTLMIQPLIIATLAGNDFVADLKGGTDVPMAPTSDYVKAVELGILGKFGLVASLDVVRRGYYPRGGGRVRFWARAWSPPPLHVRRAGELKAARVTAVACSLPRHVAEREVSSAAQAIESEFGIQPEISISLCSDGVGTTVLALVDVGTSFLGGDSLGEKGKPAEAVGKEAATSLIAEVKSGASVDVHMGDMLLPFIALCGGSFTVREQTGHMVSNAYVIRQFTGHEVKFEREGSLWRVSARASWSKEGQRV
ncbi:RNA 3'-terminal phosphate cyclase [Tardisphaera miroshnichenkoae]